MKKVGIVTINGNKNYGNKLQNYALHKILGDMHFKTYTLWEKRGALHDVLSCCKQIIIKTFPFINASKSKFYKREAIFKEFDKKNIDKYYIKKEEITDLNKEFDYFIVGSDQVWNPNVIDIYLGTTIFKTDVKIIAYAPSIGVSEVPVDYKSKIKKLFTKDRIPYISLREETGSKLISKITSRKDVQTHIDPTLLLSAEDWNKIASKPKQLRKSKYILNYFLGDLSEERANEINRIAEEYNCEVINILDECSPFYMTGPSEFLYLEKNAFLICTDSFHSSVFGLIFDRPFIIFDREDSSENMSSRLSDFVKKFNLKNRKFEGTITKENLNHDYSDAYKILEKERKKSESFLKKAMEIKDKQ